MRGYQYKHKGEFRQSAPVLPLFVPNVRSNGDLNFEELLTLRLVRAFREGGTSVFGLLKLPHRLQRQGMGLETHS